MEKYIERAGGPLPALRQIIETDVSDLLQRSVPHINTAPQPEQAAVLQFVTDALDEFFHCITYGLFQAYHALPGEAAQQRHLAAYQHTALQLLGHLLRYTDPAQLHPPHAPRNFKDACCHHLYRALNSLLEYTIRLAGGRLDPNLPLPPAARMLLQEMILGDVATLRQHLEQLEVSPALADITLAPFEALPRAYSVTFYEVRYLSRLQQALLQAPLPGDEATGDSRVCWTLVAQNFNAPGFIAYCHGLGEARLQRCPLPEARHQELHRCKARLATYPGFTPLAWQPGYPGVREQLTAWLDQQALAPAGAADATPLPDSPAFEKSAEAAGDEKETDAHRPYSSTDLILQISPRILAAIANAARILRYILWGEDGKHIAEMVARIPSVHRPLNTHSVRRGQSDLTTLRQARDLLKTIIDFFDDEIKAKEEKIFH